jgi:hypothetical protein
MRKRTLEEVLSNPGPQIIPEQYRIYLVRAPRLVLYVGQGVNTSNRLLSHLGQNRTAAPDILGECIKANASVALMWMFEEYTLEDCREITLQRRHEITGSRDEHIPLDADEVEEAMIKFYRPPLNTAKNPDPHPLPECYEWRTAQDETPYAGTLTRLLGLDKITASIKDDKKKDTVTNKQQTMVLKDAILITSMPNTEEKVQTQPEKEKLEKMSIYITDSQKAKLDDLAKEHRKRTGASTTRIDVVRMLIDQASIEMLEEN